MNTLNLENKEYVVIPRKEYEDLRTKASFRLFASLSDERFIHRPCKHQAWKALNLRCVNFRKKYIVSYLDNKSEIIVCEFALQKNLK